MSRTRRPSRTSSVRSPYAAANALCVTMTIVTRSARFRSARRSSTSRPLCESRLPVGSSASRSRGRVAMARAMATRCCSPPDSSAGYRRSRPDTPVRSSASSTRVRTSPRRTPANSSGQATLLATVSDGTRLKAWNTKPTLCRRKSASALPGSVARSFPSRITRPASGASRPAIRLRSVVFPEPLGPISETNDPARISRLMPESATLDASPEP